MNLKDNHLSEERLIAAVLAEDDLSQEEINHLDLCPSCRALRDGIAADLAGLAKLSRETVQAPPRSFKLPAEPPLKRQPSRLRLALGGSLALAAAALLAVWLGAWGPQSSPPTTALAPQDSEQLAALPPNQPYYGPDILGALDSQNLEAFSAFQQFVLGADQTTAAEEFMDFLMPEPGSIGVNGNGGSA
jgi:hypothetical protein